MRLLGSLVLAAALSAGCSSTSTAPGGDGKDAAADAPGPEEGGSGDASAPSPPQLRGLMKMAGALHVQWTLPTNPCDAVEVERKAGAAEFAVAYTLPGDVDNKHDAAASTDAMYTYRLRCKRGEAYSSYSNEMSANPKR